MALGIPQPKELSQELIDRINPQFVEIDQNHRIYRIYYRINRRDQTRRDALAFEYKFKKHRFDHHDWNRDERGIPVTISDDKGVYYAAPAFDFTEEEKNNAISCCIAECYGSGNRTISDISKRNICCVKPIETLKILDLRGKAAMKAGTQAGIGSICDREITQQWSRFFYYKLDKYSYVDGLIYTSRHNGMSAVVLYERAKDKIKIESDKDLSDYSIRPLIEDLARELNIIISPSQTIK